MPYSSELDAKLSLSSSLGDQLSAFHPISKRPPGTSENEYAFHVKVAIGYAPP